MANSIQIQTYELKGCPSRIFAQPCALYVNNALPDTETKSTKSTPVTLMDIWGGKDIRKSWCLSIFLWMRNQPSQWNTPGTYITRWDSLWGGSYRRRIGFLWLLGHPKIYSSQGACNLPCKKDNIGGAARREKWYTWAVNYIVRCVQSLFKAPLACMPIMPAWMNFCSQLPLVRFICRRTYTPGWAGHNWRVARVLHQNRAKSSSLNTIYLQTYTHTYTTCTQTLHIHNTLENGIYHQNCSFNVFCTNQTKTKK